MGFDTEKSFIMAERLKQLREERGLSHERLSKTLFDQYGVKISSDSLINYEVADANHTKAYKNQGMRVEYLRCLADYYEVSADYLLGASDVLSQDADIKMVSNATGLTEKSAAILCYARRFMDIWNDPRFRGTEIHRQLKADLAEKLGVADLIELDEDKEEYDEASFISMWAYYAYQFVNDLLDAYTSNFYLMEGYSSMRQHTATKPINEVGYNEACANNFPRSQWVTLSLSDYVRFRSGEISKAIDFYFTEKYIRDTPNSGGE